MKTKKNLTKTKYQTINNLTLKNVERIATKRQMLNSIKQKQKDPLLIVKYGPPGSGKSSDIVYNEIKKIGRPMKSFVDINIDTYVEMIEDYRNALMKGENLYGQTRTMKNKSGMSIYDKTKDILKRAIDQRSNVILEITGGYEVGKSGPLGWIYKMIDKTPYKIVVIYPKVSLQTIIKRLENRFRKRNVDELKREYKLSIENYKKYLKFPNNRPKFVKVIEINNEKDISREQ
jgi:hypothetical protein